MITSLIAAGTLAVDACEAVDISQSTYYAWLRKGRKQRRGQYRQFVAAISKAESVRRAFLLGKVTAAAKEPRHWQAAAWVLQHTDAAMFSPQLHVHVKTELSAALERLESEFKNEPAILERAYAAIVGGSGLSTAAGDPPGEGAAGNGGRPFPDPSAAIAAATRIPGP